jgi:saccharopine dehydrogenase-like NADP-dependent oxidoreductase
MKRYAVIGGAGAMGRITVTDLVEFCDKDDQIIIADYDFEKAKALAESFDDNRVVSVKVDITDRAGTVSALSGVTVIINSVQYQLNLEVMEVALALKAHYVDLGGLFHMTKKQQELHQRFVDANLTALIGMGAAPGITNILSRMGADELDQVTEIHTRVANVDQTKYLWQPALPVAYSLQTILEEFSYEPAVFTKGCLKFVKPMSGDTPQRFPAPIGVKKPMYTIHSEVATLPESFAHKGVKEVSFKIAFDKEFLEKVKFLRDMGLGSHSPLRIRSDAEVSPIEVVNKVAMSQMAPKIKGKVKQYEIVRAVVKGKKAKKKLTYVLDCHTTGMAKWGMGPDINTGCPPAIVAQMIAKGVIDTRGAIPAEIAVPPRPFVAELKKRNMFVKVQKKSGWELHT